jgi:anti-sigma factor RsiW
MTERPNPHHDLAGYLLGVLSPEEASAFEQHLRTCHRCREERAELGGLPDMLRISADTEPPPGLRQRTFDAVAAAARAPARPDAGSRPRPAAGAAPGPPPAGRPPGPQPGTTSVGPPGAVSGGVFGPVPGPQYGPPPGPADAWTTQSQQPRQPLPPTQPPHGGPSEPTQPNVIPMRPRRRTPRWLLATAAALIVVAAVGLAGVQWLRSSSDGDVTTIALSKGDIGNGRGDAQIRTVAGGREVRLQVSGLQPNGPDDHYECWFVGPGDTEQTPNRVIAGSFVVGADGTADVTMTSAADPAKYPKMGVTLEKNDGNPARNGLKALVSP